MSNWTFYGGWQPHYTPSARRRLKIMAIAVLERGQRRAELNERRIARGEEPKSWVPVQLARNMLKKPEIRKLLKEDC